jgi:hypothetical protein
MQPAAPGSDSATAEMAEEVLLFHLILTALLKRNRTGA